MPLTSALFKDDPVFEACLTKDSAHIVQGARGLHAAKVQFALMVLDRFFPDRSEIETGVFGKSTAAGVLAYKRRRNIVNKAYQQTADNIIGKMTIATMDAAMLRVERRFGIAARQGPPIFPIHGFGGLPR